MIKRILSFLVISLLILIIALTAVYFINPYDIKSDNIRPRVFGIDIYRIPSKSMLPLLSPNDYILVSNSAYKDSKPKQGDVIVFYRPNPSESDQKLPFIKRVLATEGDTVSLQNGDLFVNSKLVQERYISPNNNESSYSLNMKKVTVPPKHFFVLGDNRDNSADSRKFGSVSIDAIIGQATRILYGKNNRSGTDIE